MLHSLITYRRLTQTSKDARHNPISDNCWKKKGKNRHYSRFNNFGTDQGDVHDFHVNINKCHAKKYANRRKGTNKKKIGKTCPIRKKISNVIEKKKTIKC